MLKGILLRGLVGLAGLLVAPASAFAAAPPALVGAVSNNTSLSGTTSVAVAGNVAYTTAYWAGKLTAIDLSSPSNPTILGSTPSTPSLENGTDVTIAGPYAFVTSKNRNASPSSNDDGTGNSLTIVDISKPSAPSVLGTVTNAANPNELFGAYSVAVSGHYAFVAYQGNLNGQPGTPGTTSGGFTVIDITSPGSPSVVANRDNGSLPSGQANFLQHATSVAISGNYAYVTAFYGHRLTVIDISTPTSPSIVTSLSDSTHLMNPNNVAVAGNYAYVADQTNPTGVQFSIVNISNPAAPFVAGSLSNTLLDNAYTLRVRGNFAYLVAKNSSVMAVIDVSNPAAPQLIADVQDAGHLFSVIGIDVDSTGAYAIAASPRLSTETNPLYPPFTPTTGTISDIQLDPVPIAVSIAPSSEPPNPTNQTSANFSFSLSDQIATVACKLDKAPLGPCTSPTSAQYSALGTGSHTFTVQATDAAGITASSSYTWSVGTLRPSNTALPTISGATRQHAVLTGTLGSWAGSPSPSLSTEWLRCNSQGSSCRTIAGATGTRYTLTASDVGSRIRLSVTARNSSGSASARSAPTAIVKANLAGTFTVSAHGGPTLHLTVSVSARSSGVVRIVVALPHGLRFTKRLHRLSAGVHLMDGAGKRLRFTARLRQGTLVLTLRRAAATVRVTVGPRALSASGAVAARSSVKVTVTFTLAGGQRFRGSLRLRIVRAAAALP
jgi:hypothetical protein